MYEGGNVASICKCAVAKILSLSTEALVHNFVENAHAEWFIQQKQDVMPILDRRNAPCDAIIAIPISR